VRWPGPILVSTIGIALIGLLALPGYKTSYDDRRYIPDNVPANVGYAAAEKHFSTARLNPDIMTIESNHDMRNPTDMILLERVAKAVFHTDGIAQVQSITRPQGTPLDHTSIPFQISAQSAGQIQNLPFQQARAADLLHQLARGDGRAAVFLVGVQVFCERDLKLPEETGRGGRGGLGHAPSMLHIRTECARVDLPMEERFPSVARRRVMSPLSPRERGGSPKGPRFITAGLGRQG